MGVLLLTRVLLVKQGTLNTCLEVNTDVRSLFLKEKNNNKATGQWNVLSKHYLTINESGSCSLSMTGKIQKKVTTSKR